MRPAELFRRIAALLVAVGLLAVSVAGVSADDGDEGAAVAAIATELRPTQVRAEIPEGYGTLFPLQWGGGSLPQLKGRLAELGCAMNTLWLYDRDRWNGYNRYDLTYDFPTNQQFLQRYDQEVPAGTLYATCADQPVGNGLQPTQIIADVPEEYDTMFDLQWGGGSLLHFKGRLATMGCIANNIEMRDPGTGRTYTYNQYNIRSTDPTNQRFLATFEQFLPAGIFSVDCYRICEFQYADQTEPAGCLSFEELREQEDGFKEQLSVLYFSKPIVHRSTTCTNDFHPLVKEKVFPILPIHPDTCIVREPTASYYGLGGTVYIESVNHTPFVYLHGGNIYRSKTEWDDVRLYKEVHEFCHINQHWQWIRNLSVDSRPYITFFDEWNDGYFEHSEYGKQFIYDMMDFVRGEGGWAWKWVLPEDSIYTNIYSRNPIELSAELCTLYILDKIGATSVYRYDRYVYGFKQDRIDEIQSSGYFEWIPLPSFRNGPYAREFDTSPYLSPEVVEWLETYVVLPEIIEEDIE